MSDLYVEEHGDGDPLLLITGLGSAMWSWRRVLPALAKRRRVITFDNRGAGRSPKTPGPYSIELLADDAAAVLADRRADVLGISMGGYIALTLAVRNPQLVRSLVLVATSGGGPQNVPIPQETYDAWLGAAGLPPDEFARRTAHYSYAPGWTDEHREEYERWLAARLEHPTPPETWRAQYEACLAYAEAGVPAEEIDAPTLVLHGDADRVVPVENGRVLAARIPNARLVELPGRGHVLPQEDPDAFTAAVLEFLR